MGTLSEKISERRRNGYSAASSHREKEIERERERERKMDRQGRREGDG